MKCTTAEQQIILLDAKELAPQQLAPLMTHISGCKSCQAFQQLLTEVSAEVTPDHEPEQVTLDAVKRAARQQAPSKKQRTIIYWKPVLALAASVLIIAGFFVSSFSPSSSHEIEVIMSEAQLLDHAEQVTSIMDSGWSENDLAFDFIMSYDSI